MIGVDGGGTSCRVVLWVPGMEGLHEAVLGPANASTNFDAAVTTISDAIGTVAAKAGLSIRDLEDASAHFGLAGVMNAGISANVAAHFTFRRLTVTDDRPTTIAGALGERDGTVAAIGTGSFVGRQVAGQVRGIGGWGFYIGDQASGAWLLRRCFEEVMLSVDGLTPATDLTRSILAAHGDDPGQIVQFSLTARPADYATLAREVVGAADRGDPLGLKLMEEGAAYIRAAMAALGWREGEDLCLVGGLGPAYGKWLDLPTLTPKGTALDGALALAARAAEGVTS
ncbi:MAG: BadF/BadG/BcrA/BcrD ATPase family protein [Albidovulum sp.]|uniref:BadF/BadG/BcrA/BcrD ATPase family protein n=1 Tax=Albidovulum sp. TaxID=1872424 RepID=UPI003C988EEE